METITRDRINEILQEKVSKPVPLTSELVEQNGFEFVLGDVGINSYFNSGKFPGLITETMKTQKSKPVFTFIAYEQTFTLQYEHQLQHLLEATANS